MPRSRSTNQENIRIEVAVDLARMRWFPDLPEVKARIAGPGETYGKLTTALAWYDNAVVINPKFLEKASSEELHEVIKHELIHAWVAHHYPGEYDEETDGHSEHFIKKALEIGLDIRDTTGTYPLSKLIYKRLTNRKIDVIAPARYILVKSNPSLLPLFWGLAVLLGSSLFLFRTKMTQFTYWGIFVVMLICIVNGSGISDIMVSRRVYKSDR